MDSADKPSLTEPLVSVEDDAPIFNDEKPPLQSITPDNDPVVDRLFGSLEGGEHIGEPAEPEQREPEQRPRSASVDEQVKQFFEQAPPVTVGDAAAPATEHADKSSLFTPVDTSDAPIELSDPLPESQKRRRSESEEDTLEPPPMKRENDTRGIHSRNSSIGSAALDDILSTPAGGEERSTPAKEETTTSDPDAPPYNPSPAVVPETAEPFEVERGAEENPLPTPNDPSASFASQDPEQRNVIEETAQEAPAHAPEPTAAVKEEEAKLHPASPQLPVAEEMKPVQTPPPTAPVDPQAAPSENPTIIAEDTYVITTELAPVPNLEVIPPSDGPSPKEDADMTEAPQHISDQTRSMDSSLRNSTTEDKLAPPETPLPGSRKRRRSQTGEDSADERQDHDTSFEGPEGHLSPATINKRGERATKRLAMEVSQPTADLGLRQSTRLATQASLQSAKAGPSPHSKPAVKRGPTISVTELSADGDEYLQLEYDSAGEKKITATGQLLGGRRYKLKTFHYGVNNKLYMLATDVARLFQYRDSYLFFNKNKCLLKVSTTQEDKDEMISRGVIPQNYRSRTISLVTARSIFLHYGARIVEDGRHIIDDYFEERAKENGMTEDDFADPADANMAPLRNNGPGVTFAQDKTRLKDYLETSRPTYEAVGPAYVDQTKASDAAKLLEAAKSAAAYNTIVSTGRKGRQEMFKNFFKPRVMQRKPEPAPMAPPHRTPMQTHASVAGQSPFRAQRSHHAHAS
ncbi:chromatin structure-remodeling complex subunit RSC7 [Saitoella coloradoensis]